jgi:hypothetical protein
MAEKSNLIDLTKKIKQNFKKSSNIGFLSESEVLDMTQRRNEIVSEERREVKRTILTEFVGAFVVVPQKGLLKVAIYDISDNGIAFEMEEDAGKFDKGDEVAMRVYLNQYTYFPFTVKIKNSRWIEDEVVQRHGANFEKETVNKDALFHFVKFIETVSASLERDEGDVMVSNIK